jgi:flagellar basal body-associated protein FliL
METLLLILILIAIIAVGAAGLYVAFTFGSLAKKKIDPLEINVKNDILEQNKETKKELERQIQPITSQLQKVTTEQLGQQIQRAASEGAAASEELSRQIQAIADQLRRERELVRDLDEHIGTRHEQLSSDLQQLNHQVARLGESLARQGAKITDIHRYVKSQEMRAGNSPKMDSLELALREAESHVDRKGWGQPPHLYALTEKTSPIPADHELSAEVRDAWPNALIPVEQEPLPDGDLLEVLADIHWPEDVAGCVLVTELTALPPRGDQEAPIDPGATEQWASTRPDGRPARLAVGVCRNGAYTCGFRVKGEDDVQVGKERADDFVAALLATF